MTPQDLGFPAKFTAWRPGQEETILAAASSTNRFTLISAPTGAGKSGIVMGIAALLGRTMSLTRTKGLQDQYTEEFGPTGLVDMRGMANYRCIAVDKGGELEEFGGVTPTTCAEAPCRVGVECSLRKGGCHYYDATGVAANAPSVTSNYSYWMSINRFAEPGTLGAFNMLALDEAHASPDALADFCTIELDRHELKALTDTRMPDASDSMDTWVEWGTAAHKIAQQRWKSIRDELMLTRGPGRRKLARELKEVATIGYNLAEIAGASKWKRTDAPATDVYIPGTDTDWVRQGTPLGVRFSPVWGHAYAERYLFAGIKRVILTSATLQRRTAKDLGIADSQYDFIESTQAFAPERRRLYWVPTVKVDSKNGPGEKRILLNRIDAIIDQRLDRAGIIHCRSYERAQMIMEMSKHRGIVISHTSRTTREVVEHYKRVARTGRAIVLASPALSEGYDFPDDECRYQIIAKVPFVDAREPIIAARQRADKTYVNSLAASELMQQVGRGTRNHLDWCETLCIDDHLGWFWQAARGQGLFSRWFLAAYQVANGIPEPPPLSTGPAVSAATLAATDSNIVTLKSGIRLKQKPTSAIADELRRRKALK